MEPLRVRDVIEWSIAIQAVCACGLAAGGNVAWGWGRAAAGGNTAYALAAAGSLTAWGPLGRGP